MQSFFLACSLQGVVPAPMQAAPSLTQQGSAELGGMPPSPHHPSLHGQQGQGQEAGPSRVGTPSPSSSQQQQQQQQQAVVEEHAMFNRCVRVH